MEQSVSQSLGQVVSQPLKWIAHNKRLEQKKTIFLNKEFDG